jgi:hypothetical protein
MREALTTSGDDVAVLQRFASTLSSRQRQVLRSALRTTKDAAR